MHLLYHVGGPADLRLTPRPCGGPALGVVKKVALHGLTFPADNVLKLDGTRPVRGEAVLCATCGSPVHVSWLSYRPRE
jgi:hypothetical protein